MVMPHFGPLEIGLVVFLVLLIFGAGKLPQIGSALGRGIREFRKGKSGEFDDKPEELEKPEEKKEETIELHFKANKIKAICFDLGDTLVAEETVIHNSSGQAITADVIEGVFEVLAAIRKGGYKVAMIANGDSGARNVIKATGLQDYFDATIISEEVGIEKPCQGIFEAALAKLGVQAENAVMVGNRLDADILGANRFGMKSVWFRWNNRYSGTINSSQERPDFTINSLFELPGLLALM